MLKQRVTLAFLFLLLLTPLAARERGYPAQLSGPGWSVAIVAQPGGCYDCVTGRPGEATLFRAVWRQGQIGLLAHDYLAGALWQGLEVGDTLFVDWREYTIIEVFSWFPPGEPGRREADIYWYVYNRPGSLTLQTCLGAGYWFVIADDD